MAEDEIHRELAGFQDDVINLLNAADFFDIEGEYNPTELYASIPKRDMDAYKAASKEKNSRIWDIVKAVIIGQAIQTGINQLKQVYPRKVGKSSAQDYMNRYIKEHGGEFIKGMGRTDQKKLVDFIWSNAGVNERPMKKQLMQQPHLKYLLDSGNHRAETIVRTEKFRATEYGTFYAAKDNSFKTKAAIRSGKANTRPGHRARSGIYVPIDEPLPDGEMFAGDSSINCQCRMAYGLDISKVDKSAKKTYTENLPKAQEEYRAAIREAQKKRAKND